MKEITPVFSGYNGPEGRSYRGPARLPITHASRGHGANTHTRLTSSRYWNEIGTALLTRNGSDRPSSISLPFVLRYSAPTERNVACMIAILEYTSDLLRLRVSNKSFSFSATARS